MKKSTKFLPIMLGAATLASVTALPTNVFASTSQTAGITAKIDEYLSLTLSNDSISLDLSDMNFQSDNVAVTGSTNNAFGYTISFNTPNDYNDLKHTNSQVSSLIPSITEDKTASDFLQTAWGYSADAETFKQIPLIPTNVFATAEKGEKTNTFTIGAKAGADMAAGDYENELLFTIVANTPSTFTLSDIMYLQDMTPEICANAATPSVADGAETPQYQLIDSRDGKTYWVAKLADGNCWMTQNLDLDLTTDMVLTPADTDITSNWSPSTNTMTSLDESMDGHGRVAAYSMSYDLGNYYFNKDSENRSCRWDGTAADCQNFFSATSFTSNGDHGQIGNIYGYEIAAMAKDAETSAYSYAKMLSDGSSSICPKGWRLPNGGNNRYANEYTNLILTYYGDDGYAYEEYYGSIYESKIMDIMLQAPIYMVPAGYYDIGTYNGVTKGSFWTDFIGIDDNSMFIEFNIKDDGYNGAMYRNYGPEGMHSVRCVAH